MVHVHLRIWYTYIYGIWIWYTYIYGCVIRTYTDVVYVHLRIWYTYIYGCDIRTYADMIYVHLQIWYMCICGYGIRTYVDMVSIHLRTWSSTHTWTWIRIRRTRMLVRPRMWTCLTVCSLMCATGIANAHVHACGHGWNYSRRVLRVDVCSLMRTRVRIRAVVICTC
jgi:hypothetical protein